MGGFAKLLHRLGIQQDRDLNRADLVGGAPVADVEFRIPNMVCEGCAEKIDAALHSIAGVRDVRTNVPHKRVGVRYEPANVDPQQLKETVATAGFTAVDAERP